MATIHKKTKKRTALHDVIISVVLVTEDAEEIIEESLIGVDAHLKKLKAPYEILVVDNNSGDNTVEKISKLSRTIQHARMIVLSKRYTLEIALTAGLDNCIGDYVILFNMYTDPPEVLPKLLEKLLEGYDIVIGKATSEVISYDYLSKLFLSLIKKVSRHQFVYSQNYLLGLNRKAVNSIMQTRRKSRNLSYLNSLIGFAKTTFFYKPIKKYRHKLRKESFFEVILNASDIIISNSYRPIRFLAFFGMFASILFIVYVAFIAFNVIFFNRHLAPQGWITIGAVLGTMFFFLFLFLTIISEYIIRILNESRNEPFYFITTEVEKSVILPGKDPLNIV